MILLKKTVDLLGGTIVGSVALFFVPEKIPYKKNKGNHPLSGFAIDKTFTVIYLHSNCSERTFNLVWEGQLVLFEE